MGKASRAKRKQPPKRAVIEIGASQHASPLHFPLAILLGLALLTVVIYSNTFAASFSFDDLPNIVDNARIKHLSNMLDFSGSRYVGFFTFTLNYHFGQLHLFGYHLVNLLIHLTNGVLVYFLVRLLIRAAHRPPVAPDALRPTAEPPAVPPSTPWIALAAAALFLVHPVQTEAVTYIVQRLASLAALFYLLTVICYLQWRLSPVEAKSRLLWYGAALLTTVLAMKTKENTFTLPFMLLLVEVVFFGLPTRRGWLSLLPFFLTLPIIPLSRPGALGEGEVGFASATTDISRLEYLFTQFRVIVTYLRLLVLPVHQNLDYDYPVYHSLFQLPVFFSFLGLLGLGGGALWLLLRRPGPSPTVRLMAFGVLWFFLSLAIESSIIPIPDVIFEHRLYLPSVGLFLAAGAALLRTADRRRSWEFVVVGLVVALFAVATYERNLVWKNGETLWSDVVLKSPQKSRGHNNLGRAYEDEQRLDDAIREYQTALTLKSDNDKAHINLGSIYEAQGRLNDAIKEYQTALTIKPNYVITHNNLGNIYKAQGRLDEAIREYQTASTLDPNYADSHYNLGIIYRQMGKYDQAIEEYNSALSLKPEFVEAHNNLGNIYQIQGRLDDALQEYQQAIALDSENPDAFYNQGLIYYGQGKLHDALAVFEQAVQLKPDDADAQYRLGLAYQRTGERVKAAQAFQQALTIKPDYQAARQALESLGQ
jgi:tetratricopeptide (TPR) repeat protein